MTTAHVHAASRLLPPLAACVALTVALLGPPGAATSTAHADPADADAKFLTALTSQGITFASPQVMIAAAHLVCAELDQGETPVQVLQDVMNNQDVLTNSNLDEFHTGFFVGASIGAYCPKYLGQIPAPSHFDRATDEWSFTPVSA
ncbi:DUF732 domain-containing protein [Mycobacterium nebraskense]|nr:DUF732 domain-containing protein [Mycobacterium nebraskense]MBI2695186.1 DUF732 domain-containing protein [Mycobacterium nebraskense]MCV7118882.1 DUF732 domain-containing protein [Mycobacterium nebraskense]